MPLFIDYHQFDHVTIDQVKEGHIADLAIQDKYGVQYHQFWVNEEAGTVFCLMEGPDAETCAMVHKMAHGNVACAITEVKDGAYKKAMVNTVKSGGGLATFKSGEADLGYRTVLVVSVRGITRAKNTEDLNLLLIPMWAIQIVVESFRKYSGREINWANDDSLIAIFDHPTEAVQCAKLIQKELLKGDSKNNPSVVFKMGLNTGQPVTEDGDFFDKVIRLSHRLSTAADDNQVFVSTLTQKLCKETSLFDAPNIKCMTPQEEVFFVDIFNTIEDNLSNELFSINKMSKVTGVSKSQLYRKITSITGRSPNYFLRDIRLEKARILLQQKEGNISEVAYRVGFNSPGYFTRVFKERYGTLPTLLCK